MNWPKEDWTKASYYFPHPGEVTRWGPFWQAGYGGWLHFAGEHTSYAFMGYMEGALSSGFRLARRIAVRDGLLAGRSRAVRPAPDQPARNYLSASLDRSN